MRAIHYHNIHLIQTYDQIDISKQFKSRPYEFENESDFEFESKSPLLCPRGVCHRCTTGRLAYHGMYHVSTCICCMCIIIVAFNSFYLLNNVSAVATLKYYYMTFPILPSLASDSTL